MSSDKSIRKSISLYPEDWEYIEAFADRFNMGRSAAVRFLINDRKQLKKTYEPTGGEKEVQT